MRQVLASFAVLFLVSACAVGNQYDYNSTVPPLSAATEMSVAVATHDVRPYIVSAEKAPNFVGLQRGGFGNPFDVTTLSGNALATDMTRTLTDGLRQKAVKAEAVVIPPVASRSEVLEKLDATQAERSLLITLHEWKSDNMFSAALIYDIEAEVLDRGGKILAANSMENREPIGAATGLSLSDAVGTLVGTAYKRIMAELLNDEAIVKALK